MVARAFSSCRDCVSIRLTVNPFWAKTCAMPLPMVPAPITEIFCIWLVVVPEITPFPGLDKIRPGDRVEDILGRGLSLVVIFGCALLQGIGGCLACIGRQASGKDLSLGGAVVLAGDFYIVIRH